MSSFTLIAFLRLAASTAAIFWATIVGGAPIGQQLSDAVNPSAETVSNHQQNKLLSLPPAAISTSDGGLYPMLSDELLRVDALGSAHDSADVLPAGRYYPPIMYPAEFAEEEATRLLDEYSARRPQRLPTRTRIAAFGTPAAAKRSFAFSRGSPLSGLVYTPARG